MPITIGQVSSALTRSGLVHHRLGEDALLMAIRGASSRARLAVSVDAGRYLHVRTLGLGYCPPMSVALERVASFLTEANLRYPCVKYGWNPEDGEVCLESDLPVEDNPSISDAQITGLILGLLRRCDADFPALQRALSGIDPGAIVFGAQLGASGASALFGGPTRPDASPLFGAPAPPALFGVPVTLGAPATHPLSVHHGLPAPRDAPSHPIAAPRQKGPAVLGCGCLLAVAAAVVVSVIYLIVR